MSTHRHHERLEGFHPDQLLHDGCKECEQRGKDPYLAISHLDDERFTRAWIRATDLNRSGGRAEKIWPTLSDCEMPLLRTLWAVAVQLQRRGIPIGDPPTLLDRRYPPLRPV